MQNQSSFTTPNPNPAPTGAAGPAPVPDPANSSAFTSNPQVPQNPQGYQYAAAPTLMSQPLTNPHITSPAAAPYDPYAQKSKRNLIEIIVLVVVSLIAVTFIGLFIWKYLDWDSVKTDVDGQIDAAVAMAVSENTTKLENEFLEREKYPYKTFSGPADYGSLNFEFPKTWNTYIAADASNGGNFEAYLNPGEVQPVSAQTINALRVQILDQSFENVARNYDRQLQSGQMTVTTRPVGTAVANVYTGNISNNIYGIVTIFKVRDKTILLQTDAELFAEEYYKLLDTVTFAE